MTRLVLNARRVSFNWTALPRNIANVPAAPRWRMRSGAAANDDRPDPVEWR